jgi:hypothetical protein
MENESKKEKRVDSSDNNQFGQSNDINAFIPTFALDGVQEEPEPITLR